jgi:hypothetical protein
MNKKVNKVLSLEQKYIKAKKIWHDELMALIEEYGELEIRDENEGDDLNGDYSKRINTQDANHNYVYSPSFDRVKVIENFNGKQLAFRVKNGDGLFDDGQWVSEYDFADWEYEELLDWIVFPDE